MTHIEQVNITDFKSDLSYMLIKPKRTINVGDKLIMENDNTQREETIVNNTTSPGLMKGWQLLEFKREV
jgi:hypothetical protein